MALAVVVLLVLLGFTVFLMFCDVYVVDDWKALIVEFGDALLTEDEERGER